jgi:hypothetical protein
MCLMPFLLYIIYIIFIISKISNLVLKDSFQKRNSVVNHLVSKWSPSNDPFPVFLLITIMSLSPRRLTFLQPVYSSPKIKTFVALCDKSVHSYKYNAYVKAFISENVKGSWELSADLNFFHCYLVCPTRLLIHQRMNANGFLLPYDLFSWNR